jgi:hypothetical protein
MVLLLLEVILFAIKKRSFFWRGFLELWENLGVPIFVFYTPSASPPPSCVNLYLEARRVRVVKKYTEVPYFCVYYISITNTTYSIHRVFLKIGTKKMYSIYLDIFYSNSTHNLVLQNKARLFMSSIGT